MPIMDGYEACQKIRQAYADFHRMRKGAVPLLLNHKDNDADFKSRKKSKMEKEDVLKPNL